MRTAVQHRIDVTVNNAGNKIKIDIKHKQKVNPTNDGAGNHDTVLWTLKGGLVDGKIRVTKKDPGFPYATIDPTTFAEYVTASVFHPSPELAEDGRYTLEIQGFWDVARTDAFTATIDPDIVIDRGFFSNRADINDVLSGLAAIEARLDGIEALLVPSDSTT